MINSMIHNMIDAEKLSIPQLQQALRNGTVPPYVGIPLLQQKVQMQKQAQAQAQGMQPAKPPIAQQVMAEADQSAHAPQGIPSLPSNLPVEHMAGGGIIAFEGGGDVIEPHHNYNLVSDKEGNIHGVHYGAGLDAHLGNLSAGANYETMIDKLGIADPRLHDVHAAYRTEAGNEYRGSYNPDARQVGIARRTQEGNELGLDVSPEYAGIHGVYHFAQGGDVKHFANEGLVTLQNELDALNRFRRTNNTMTRAGNIYGNVSYNPREPGYAYSKMYPTLASLDTRISDLQNQIAAAQPKPAAPAPAATPPQATPAATPDQAVPTPADNTQVPANQHVAPPAMPDGIGGIGGISNPLKNFKLSPMETLDEAKFVGKEDTLADIQKARTAAYKEAGVNTNLYKDAKDKIDKHLDDVDTDKKDAVWNALMMAGLGAMGGTSQYALTNIANGAMPALKGYNEAIDKLDAKKERLEDRKFALSDAENKFKQTGADSDLAELRTAKRDYKNANREYEKFRVDTANRFNEKQDALREKVLETDMNLKLEGAKMALQKYGLNLQAYDAETRRNIAERPDLQATLIQMAQSDPEFRKLSGTKQAEKLAEIMQIKSAGTGSQGFTYKKELEAEFGVGGNKDLIAEYNRIKKDKGFAAAEAFKADYINRRVAGLPGIGETPTLQQSAATGQWGKVRVN